MKKIFKYDYLNKKRNFCIILMSFSIVLFLYFCFKNFNFSLLCFLPIIVLFFLATISYSKKGITIDYKKRDVVVSDNMGKHVFPIEKIEKVSLKEIKKENKGTKKLFFLFFIGAKEEIDMWEYVYNKGRTFYVIFKIKDQSGYIIHKSYFGWMYKEKNQLVIDEVLNKLNNIINEINILKVNYKKIK